MDKSLLVVLRLPPQVNAAPATPSTPQTSSADEGDISEPDVELVALAPVAPRVCKKRKPTYEARKEEIASKQQEVVALREELLKHKAEQLRALQPLAAKFDARATMQTLIVQNRLAVATAQSLVASYGACTGAPLLGNYIHLPVDPVERQQMVESLKATKMEEAVAFMLARTKYTDLSRQSRQLEKFESENGDLTVIDWEISRFTDSNATVASVFEEMVDYKKTVEMTLAEKLGVVTIRESDICSENTDAAQVRMVSQHHGGLQVEKNVVMYAQYFAKSDLLDQPHAVTVSDYVDQDDAFPYQSLTRLRKDVSTVVMAVQCPTPASLPSSSSTPHVQPAVALIKWSFYRLHHSPLATLEDLDRICSETVGQYSDLMVRTIRERLPWRCHQS